MKILMIILTAMFTAAKLCGTVTWPWWLVLAPVIIYVGFWALLILFGWIVCFIISFFGGFKTEYDKAKEKHDEQ